MRAVGLHDSNCEMGDRVRWLTRAYWGPVVLLLAALAVASSAWFGVVFRDTRLVEEAFGAGRDAILRRTFAVPYPGLYEVRLEMDQAAAVRLFPCAADTRRFDDQSCREAVIPVNLEYDFQWRRDLGERRVRAARVWR